MRHTFAVSLLCACLTLSCADPAVPEEHQIANRNLSESYKDFQVSIIKERTPLLFEGGGSASNCRSYLDIASKHRIEESVSNQLVKSEYLVCDVMGILPASSPARPDPSSLAGMGEAMLSRLDLRSFPSSLRMASDDKSHTLATLFPGRAKAEGNSAKIETEEFALTLEVVAVARVNENAADDWIVWLFDESKTGNYRGYQTLIILDPAKQGAMAAAAYP